MEHLHSDLDFRLYVGKLLSPSSKSFKLQYCIVKELFLQTNTEEIFSILDNAKAAHLAAGHDAKSLRKTLFTSFWKLSIKLERLVWHLSILMVFLCILTSVTLHTGQQKIMTSLKYWHKTCVMDHPWSGFRLNLVSEVLLYFLNCYSQHSLNVS